MNAFTARASTTLAANTTYHVCVSAMKDGTRDNIQRTSSNAEDIGGATGRSIGDTRYWRNSFSAAWKQPVHQS